MLNFLDIYTKQPQHITPDISSILTIYRAGVAYLCALVRQSGVERGENVPRGTIVCGCNIKGYSKPPQISPFKGLKMP